MEAKPFNIYIFVNCNQDDTALGEKSIEERNQRNLSVYLVITILASVIILSLILFVIGFIL